MPRVRARELGLPLGRFKPGKYNAITDVEGVLVGHCTLIRGEGPLRPGHGPVRTGVTAILPNNGNIFMERMTGGGFVLNGAGEVSGMTQLMEWGLVETPIMLTNTMAVGAVSDGVARYLVDRYPGIGDEHDVIIPIVGECDDSWLNDVAGRHVRDQHVLEAIHNAKSRPGRRGQRGRRHRHGHLRLQGRHRHLVAQAARGPGRLHPGRAGDVQLREDAQPARGRPARGRGAGREVQGHAASAGRPTAPSSPWWPPTPRCSATRSTACASAWRLGIGRVGSYAAHGSGEIVVGFSTANIIPRRTQKMVYKLKILLDQRLDPLYEAVMEATEEAILNSMCMAEPMKGVNDNYCPALPLDEVRRFVDACRPIFASVKKRPQQSERPRLQGEAVGRRQGGRGDAGRGPADRRPERRGHPVSHPSGPR